MPLSPGSSAPEILLAVIGIIGNNFESEALGPSTIVGSASFNLLAISAVCIAGVPTGEIRRIKAFPVFIITSFFSVFAYIWIVIVLVVSTPVSTIFCWFKLGSIDENLVNSWFPGQSGFVGSNCHFPLLPSSCCDRILCRQRPLQQDLLSGQRQFKEVGGLKDSTQWGKQQIKETVNLKHILADVVRKIYRELWSKWDSLCENWEWKTRQYFSGRGEAERERRKAVGAWSPVWWE